ncbi:hypothetical protein, partial [Rhodococcoides fascians]|uniref:hypothetical protein n=2 Tax=Mycobacteriales TaxID=85007 RepID=UPI0009B90CDF
PHGYTAPMTDPKHDENSAPDAEKDVTSDPAAAAEDNDWSSEGGAIETGPATSDERTDSN